MPILTAEERLGTVLGGRYALESIVGTGGTSVVYAATHSFTQRKVALKILKPEHGRNRELVSRFLKEARVASTLVHPNVVAILDMGTTDGETYLAMELLAGESLSALLAREGALTSERAIALLRPLMEAVALAHERGIVHRDLKPDNVLVGDRGDGQTRAVLLDFGMAKTVEVAWGHMTQSGILVGTPFYMSPEQAEGASDVDAASDVWSMGVTLYRCLSGELPFQASAPSALLLAIARGDHVPLDRRTPSLPPAIAAWIEGALVLDRARRYPNMRAMLDALDRALAGHVASPALPDVVPANGPPEIAPTPGRARWLVALLAAGLLAAVAWAAYPAADSAPSPPTLAAPSTEVRRPAPPSPVSEVRVAPSVASTPVPIPPASVTAAAAPTVARREPSSRGVRAEPARPAAPETTTPPSVETAPVETAPRSSSGLASEW